MSITVKTVVVVIGALAAIAIILVIAAVSAGFIAKPIVYEIAEPFNDGWVTITYENPNCKPLEEDGLFLVVHVDETGKGCSSNPIPQGWRYTKYVRVGKNGERTALVSSSWASEQSRMIWAGAVMTPQGGYPHAGEIFFVGTAAQLKDAWPRQPVPK